MFSAVFCKYSSCTLDYIHHSPFVRYPWNKLFFISFIHTNVSTLLLKCLISKNYIFFKFNTLMNKFTNIEALPSPLFFSLFFFLICQFNCSSTTNWGNKPQAAYWRIGYTTKSGRKVCIFNKNTTLFKQENLFLSSFSVSKNLFFFL